jgi:1-aminocyclopropane-1-carboxylate deaminase/D-cysteine desulfhydrase-like pyridoxal-dependent ACC family enzyme
VSDEAGPVSGDESIGSAVAAAAPTADLPLLIRYPGTRDALPRVPLAHLPTPVLEAPALAEALGAGELWFKRDDVSAPVYGGNKVRKLEFLLGDARAAGATDLITFGAAGSNHALATAIYGAARGFAVHSMLMPQPNASYVRRNLLAAQASGADLHMFGDGDASVRGGLRLKRKLATEGRVPFLIPFGGTNARSTAGFVSAGLELAAQVAAGDLPEPELVFVALGSMGTAAGIALGMRAAGLSSHVVGVPVVSYEANTTDNLLLGIIDAQAVLAGADPSFPRFAWAREDFLVATGFLGERYALFTREAMEAVGLAERHAGVHLEGTYTGKTLSALVAQGRGGALRGKRVLFWNTYNSRDIGELAGRGDASKLPKGLRSYFDQDVQELDG